MGELRTGEDPQRFSASGPAIPAESIYSPDPGANASLGTNANPGANESSKPVLPVPRKRPHGGFQSVLYDVERDATKRVAQPVPEYFRDLNLDQIVDAITGRKEEYDLKPFFYEKLGSVEAIGYRHDAMRDLERPGILPFVNTFAGRMQLVREKIRQSEKLYYPYQKLRWFLHAAELYCLAIRHLNQDLSKADFSSRAFVGLRNYVAAYAESEDFTVLLRAAAELASDLGAVRYSVLIRETGFTVQKYDAEEDYSAKVSETFEKFQQEAAKNYLTEFPEGKEMNHIEAKVLDFVALLYPDLFSRLESFQANHGHFIDPILARFDREVQFYVAYLAFTDALKRKELQFCYPALAVEDKDVHVENGFDLALASKLLPTKTPVIRNDFHLQGKERIFIVSGPNQGGKTTFARTFGQLHHLASIGCPVPGRTARLFLFDSIYVHFEREENIHNLHGKLQDDLVRIHEILEKATPHSIIIMNEIFTSTTLKDATFLARKVLEKIIALDCLCVCVTFLDELASLSDTAVSMVSTVVPDNPAMRTYRVIRRPADGRSYAISIAEKYRVTYDALKARIPS